MDRDLAPFIRDIPDFPVEGILFKDITPLLQDADALRDSIDALYERYKDAGIDMVVGIESRGFIFGVPLAYKLGVGFVPIRKPNKLPAQAIHVEYALEYGTNALELHTDALKPGQRVLVVDDLLATGGSAQAACNLVEQLGASVAGLAFVIELVFLRGIEKLAGYDVFSLVKY